MWRHHLRTALRSLRRNRSHALLGGLSLTVAIAACILIALFVRDERSFDRSLPNADDVSAIGTRSGMSDRDPFTSTPYLLAGALNDEAPEVAAATVTFGDGGTLSVLYDQREAEVTGIFADSLFLDVFAYPFLAGDAGTALDAPDGAVFTASAAMRVFGRPIPMGETVRVISRADTIEYTVRGVIPDRTGATNVDFEAVFAFGGWRAKNPGVATGWGGLMYQTYARTHPQTPAGALQRSLDRVNQTDEWGQEGTTFHDVPLRDFRLSEFSYVADGFGGDAAYVRMFSLVALLILVLGAVNYVNLAVARGERRAQEVGVRKALGSGRRALVQQFLTESVVLAGLAAVAGVVLAALLLPAFNETFVKELALSSLDAPFVVALGLGSVVVGVVAGLYPALYLSRFEADRVLRASAPRDGGGAFLTRTWIRRALVTFQFGAAVLLLIGTAAIARQLDYATSAPLGFEPDGVAALRITDESLVRQPDVLKRALLESPHVEAVAGSNGYPTKYNMAMTMRPDPDQPDRDVSWKNVGADPDFARVLGMEMAAGQWPSRGRPGGEQAVVVNESFVDEAGWPGAASGVGRELAGGMGTVVGVVRDYHFDTFREPVGAVVTSIDRINPREREAGAVSPSYGYALVRFAPGREAEGLADVLAAYRALAPESDAPEPVFLSDAVDEMYADEARLVQTFGMFALIAIVIACLGLVGLATYAAQRRTKEIGVRRVLGASVSQIVSLLSREYVALAAVGAAVAIPLGVVLVRRWLETFVYRTTLGVGTVALVVLAALALATLTVGVLAARAAHADPTRSLRTE